jgi:hypothetical protein
VQALIGFFFNLCLLRRAPQDLPASETLFRLVLIAHIAIGILLSLASGVSPVESPDGPLPDRSALSPLVALIDLVLGSLVDVSLMLALLYLGLRLVGHLGRFNQSANALLGADTLIGVLALPAVLTGAADADSLIGMVGGLIRLALLCWSILVTAHILRHSFEIGLAQAIGLAVAYVAVSVMTIGLLFGGL